MEQVQESSDRNQQVFLEGMRKYLERGIPIYVDGEMADDKLLKKIVERSEEGFYKSEYIMEEETSEVSGYSSNDSYTAFHEPIAGYYAGEQRSRSHLKEIHFCKIYYSSM